MVTLLHHKIRRATISFVFFCLLIILSGCGGIRLTRALKTDNDSAGLALILIPPLEKYHEVTTVAGFPKDAGVICDSFLFVSTFNGEVRIYNLYTGKSAGYFDAGACAGSAVVAEGSMMYIPLTKDKNSFVAYDFLEKSIQWKIQIGNIETKPLVINNDIYVVTSEGKCYDIKKNTGIINWTFTTPGTKKGSIVHSAPATDTTNIYFGTDEGVLLSVDRLNGKLVWKYQTKGNILSTPVVSNGIVYATTTKNLVFAIKGVDGSKVWEYDASVPLYSSLGQNDENVFLSTSDGRIVALKKINGSVTWQYKNEAIFNTTPLICGNVLYIGSLRKNLMAFEAGTGKQLWEFPLEGRVKSNPIAYKDKLIVFAEDRSILFFTAKGQP